MKTVYFVRHGESTANVGAYFENDDIAPLTKKGREQAQLIADRCVKLPVDAFLASPMPRARETAEYISKSIGKPFELSPELVERRIPSSLFSLKKDDPKARGLLEAWDKEFFTDTETFRDIRDRAGRVLHLLAKHQAENILVVTHGFLLRTLFASVLFGDRMTPQNLHTFVQAVPQTQHTHISVFRYHDGEAESLWRKGAGWRVWVWNDHAHLG